MSKLLTNGTTSNYQLIEEAQKLGIPLKRVAFKDQLLHHPPEDGGYIINMQDSSQGAGTHWVGLFLVKSKYRAVPSQPERIQPLAYYFDSYGQSPPEAVLKFAKAYGAEWLWHSNEQLQAINTNYCGQFTLQWLYDMSKKGGTPGERYHKFLSRFRAIRTFS
jgi:hypothetical protein